METLEPRLLLSADPVSAHLGDAASLLPAAPEPGEAAADALEALIGRAPRDGEVEPEGALADPDGVPANEPVAPLSRELVFVDAGIEDADRLLADLLRGGGDRHVEVVMLDAQRDGIAQMSEAIAHYRDLDAVHVLSHGTSGAVQLGSTVLDGDSVSRYADAIRGWGYSLDEDADLLFYGCNLAAGADGRDLVGELAVLTGADVAASEDLTGASTAGGDWELEYSAGVVEAAPAIEPGAHQAWLGVLDAAAAGGEFPVNATIGDDQTVPPDLPRSVAADASGNFVVVWESVGQDGDGLGIYGQRFDAAGNPVGPEFPVNSEIARDQSNAAVAMNAGGEFVVVWQSDGQDGDAEGVYAQRYDATGATNGPEFRVNTTVAKAQLDPDVALHDDGSFVVTWSGENQDGDRMGVYAQRYDALGVAQGGEIPVNTWTAKDQVWSSIAATPDGGFVVTWSSDAQDGDGFGVYAQRFDAAGDRLGVEMRVSTEAAKDQQRSQVDVAADGAFVVVWESDAQDGNGFGIYAQRFFADGSRDGGEFQVNQATSKDQLDAAVAVDASGNFVVAWTSDDQDGNGLGVYARQYDSLGAPIAGEALVNTNTAGDQSLPSVTLGDAGRHVIVWGGEAPADDVGIHAQRYLGTALPGVDLNGAAAGTDFSASFVEDGGPVPVTDAAAILGDPDGATLHTLTVLITNVLDGAAETLDADVSGTAIVKSYAAGVLTLTGPDSIAAFQQVLRTVTYDNASQAPTSEDRVLRFVPKDVSGLDGLSAYATVSVSAVNDAPVIAAPPAGTLDEDSVLVLSQVGGNAVSIADDARDAPVEVTLTVGEGDLSLSFADGAGFQVNTTTADDQLAPAVAVAADGRYVVAWQSKDPTKGWNVHAQLYAADGSSLSGEVIVASGNDDETSPVVAIGEDGHFVVIWEVLDTNPDNGKDIYARSFDDTGSANTGAVRLNTTTIAPQSAPDIAMDADGNVVVAWQSRDQDGDKEGIVVRRFDATLGTVTGELIVNETTGDAQTAPAIAMTDAGGFVVAWQSKNQDGSGEGIYARLFDAAANPLTGEFLANLTTAGNQHAPDVAVDDSGEFVIAWQSDDQDGDKGGVYARRFDASGAALGGEVQVNTITVDNQAAPTVAMTADGHFVVAWQSDGQDDADGRSGIYLREFDPGGAPLRPELLVNTVTADDQDAPAVAIRGDSASVVVWHSHNQDGDKGGIFGQRFLRPGAIDFASGDGIGDAEMTFTGEVADINRALDGLIYTPSADFWGADTLSISVDDLGNTGSGGPLGAVTTVDLTVNPVNDPIALTLPGAHAADEDEPIVFAAASGNAISVVDDADDDGSDIELDLSVAQGTLTFATTAGLTFISGTDGDAAMIVRGTPADIRAALDGLTYTPDAHYFGADALNVLVDDLGNTGTGGPYTQAGTVAITVTSVNDAPVHQLPAAPSTLENTALFFSSGAGNAITVSDPDAASDDIEMTLEVDRGTLTLAGTAGLTFSSGSGSADARMTFEGGIAEINAALEGLRFDPPPGYAGPVTLRLVSNDLGNNGPSGIALGDDDVLFIDVVADGANDAPENTVPGSQSTTEETPLTFSVSGGNGISMNDDAGGNPVEVTLAASGGTVTLSSTAGAEFQVNSAIAGEQLEARAAMAADGSFVVVWQSKDQDSSSFGVYAQRYTAAGVPVGGEFQVNATVAGSQAAPEVAMAADGSFTVAWESNGQDGDKHGVFARRFDAGGLPLGPELQVNTVTADEQRAPAVASDAAGNFVVTWQSKGQDGSEWGIHAQRFDAAGVAQGSEFRVNTTTVREQSAPVVAMDADGDFVVAWQSENQDGDRWGIYAQRFDASGAAQGGEFLVNTVTFKEQLAPSVAMDADGDFVIAWQSRDLDYPDDRYGIYLQRFDAVGTFLDGGQRLVNTTTPAEQTRASVSMASAGGFVVAWQGEKQDHPDNKTGVFAQRFAADGSALGGEFLVNTTTAKAQTAPSVAMGDGGRFAVVWTGDGQDGDATGVFGQRYRDAAALDFISGDGDADATLTVRGTLDEINDALDGLVFTPDVDFYGTAQLTVTTDDLGSSGSGGARSDVDVIDIDVVPVNDAPAVAMPGAQSIAQGGVLAFATGNGNAVSIADSDAGAGDVRVRIDGVGGLVSLGSAAGLTFLAGDGLDDASMTFTGTLAEVNAALEGMTWAAPADFAGTGSLHVAVDDQDAVNALGDTAGVSITVVPDAVNDAPRIQVPDPQRTGRDEPVELSAALGNGIAVSDDAAGSTVRVTLDASNGRMTLTHSAGPERLVNTETVETQDASRVAMAPDGSYTVVWQSKDQDGGGVGVYAQRFDAAGLPVGVEFQVNTTTASDQTAPVIAVDASGRFIVAWVSNGQDGDGRGIYAQRFDAAGVPLGGEFLVNTDIAGNQQAPSLAMDASGAFVVVWEGDDGAGVGILAQRYDADGVAQGAETVINATTGGNQTAPSVAMDGAGNFVVVWQDSDGSGQGVFAQRFDAAGMVQGPEFRVHTGTSGDQQLPVVAMNASGTFAVAWQGEDAGGDGVFVRAFDDAGTPLTGNLRANSTTAGNQESPAVAINDAGEFAVVWQSGDANGKGVFGRLFAADGSTLEGEFRVNTTTAADQTAAAVALGGDGIPVATWTSVNQDGDKAGVYVQHLLGDGALVYSTGDGVDDATIVFTGSLADVNAALDGIVFTPGAGYTGVAGIDIEVDDLGNTGTGGALEDIDHVDILVGNAPLVDLDADDSSGADGAGFQATFTAGAGAVSIVDTLDALFEDPDDGNLSSVKITLTNALDGAAEVLSVNTGGTLITAVPAGNSLTLSGPDSIASFEQVLRTLTYDNAAATPTTGERLVEVVANDGDGDGNTAVAAVAVVLPDADPPVEVANAGSSVDEGGFVTIVAADLSHADAQQAAVIAYTVTRTPGFGQLELATAPGVPVAGFTQADVDAGLLRYRHDGSETVGDSFGFDVDDGLGHVLSGRNFVITVTPVNDAPGAADDAYKVDEDTVLNPGDAWFDAGWSDRIRLTFDNAARGEALVDVPVLVTLDATRVDYAGIRDGGEDLRFVDGDGTVLAHEIERWDESGTSYVWVKIPTIDAGSAGDFIWMYYGNAGAADGQNPGGVWDNDYRGVWHLDETSGQHVDATGRGHDAGGGGGLDKDAAGQVAGADDFDGSNDYLWVNGSDTGLQITGDVTLQAWVNIDAYPPNNDSDAGNEAAIVEFSGFFEDSGSNYLYALILQQNGDIALGHESGAGVNHFQDMGVNLALDTWYHLSAVRDATAKTWTLYVDGVQAGAPFSYAADATGGAGGDLYIGWDWEYFDGTIDEVRVAAAARSADWIAAQYAAQSDGFITYGAPQQVAGVLDNDADAEGDTLSAVLLSGPSNAASFVLNPDGTFSYTPDADFVGSDSFTYRAHDGDDMSAPGTVTITVNPVNDAPSFTLAGDQNVLEDSGTHTVAGFATPAPGGGPDESGQTFTYTVTGNTNAGLFLAGPAIDANGELTYTLNPDVTGTATLTVSMQDSGGTADGGDDTAATVDFDLTVDPWNDAPVLGASVAATTFVEDAGAVIIDPGMPATDVDGLDFAGGTLTVQFLDGNDAGDLLWVRNEGTAPGEVSVAGTVVSYNPGTGSVDVGVLSGGTDATGPLVVAFNAAADQAAVQAVARNVTYDNASAVPAENKREVQFTLTDGDGGTSNDQAVDVKFVSEKVLWFSAKDSEAPSDALGGGQSWLSGDVVAFGDGATFETGAGSTTGGTFENQFSFTGVNQTTLAAEQADLRALHYVRTMLTLGSGADTYDLEPGDVIAAIDNGDTLRLTGSDASFIDVDRRDLFVFRPDTPGDYTAGTFTKLLENPFGNNIHAITLVEETTHLGSPEPASENQLFAGDFLVSYSGGSDHNDVYKFTAAKVVTATDIGTPVKMLEGSNLGFTDQVQGLELVEKQVDLGDTTLAGTLLLMTLDNDQFGAGNGVGANDLSVRAQDVFALDITGTEASGAGNTAATATLLFEGSDVALGESGDNGEDDNETFDGLTLARLGTVNFNAAPGVDIASATYSVDENTTFDLLGRITVTDPDAGAGIVQVTLDVDEGILSVDPDTPTTGVTAGGSGTGSVTLTGTLAQINALLAGTGSAALGYDALDAPSASATLTVTIDDQGNTGGAPKTGVDTASLDITAENDAPALDNTAALVLDDVAEDSANPPGNSVTAILASAATDPVTDPDAAAAEGIAVIGVDDANGTWQYSTDDGVSWTSFVVSGVANGGVDDSAAVLLAGDARIRFLPEASYTGPAGDITFRAWDQSAGSGGDTGVAASVTGGGTAFSDATDTATLTVNPAGSVTNAVPASQTVDEDGTLIFSTANGNAVSVSDNTGSDVRMRVTLTVTGGTLTLNGVAGLSFQAGANGSATMTFVGLESAINAAMDGMIYAPAGDYAGAAGLQIESSASADLQARWTFDSGGAQLGDDTSPGGGNNGAVSGASQVFDAERASVLDFDGVNDHVRAPGTFGDPGSLTVAGWVKLDAGFLNDEFISLGDNVGIRLDDTGAGNGVTGFFYDGVGYRQTPSGSFINGTGWHHVAFVVDGAADEQVIYLDGVEVGRTSHAANISYSLGSDTYLGRHGFLSAAFLHGRLDDMRVYDTALGGDEIGAVVAGRESDTDSVDITVNPVNDAPDGADVTLTTLEDTPRVLQVADFGFTDPDGHALDAVRIVSLPLPGTGVLTNNGTAVAAGDVLDVTDIALGRLIFTPAPDSSGPALASFGFQVRDDGGSANGGVDIDPTVNTLVMDVTPVNDAPSFTILGNQHVQESSGLNTVAGFATADPGGGVDESGQTFTYTVTGNTNAALFAAGPAIDANGDLSYTLNPGVGGTATISVSMQDSGGTVNGGGDTAAAVDFDITVEPANGAPVADVAMAVYVTAENTALALHGTGLSVADPDAGASAVQATLAVGEGKLVVIPGAGGVSVTGSGTASVILLGPVAAINNLLDGVGGASVSYVASDTPSAGVSLTLTVDDLGNSGFGGPLSDSDTAAIAVSADNDAPSADAGPADRVIAAGGAFALQGTGMSIADVDAGGLPVRATLSVGEGALAVSAGSTGVTVSGSGTANVVLGGTVTAINNLLAGSGGGTVSYTPGAAPALFTAFTLTVDDLGNSGAGGALSASDSSLLSIAPAPDPEPTPEVAAAPDPDPAPEVDPDPEPDPGEEPEPDEEPVLIADEDPRDDVAAETTKPARGAAAAPVVGSDVGAVLAPALAGLEAADSDRDPLVGRAETIGGGLELLRELILQRAPDELLVLDDANVRPLPTSLTTTLLEELDQVRDEANARSDTEELMVASTTTLASGLSVGYVVWLVRGGVLLSSVLSSLPAWRLVDPLPVLGRMDDEEDEDFPAGEDEGLDEMIDDAGERVLEER